VQLPAPIQENIRDRIDGGQCVPALFADALAFIVSDLQEDFDRYFPDSEQFAILQEELMQIDNKMIAFFHEDPAEFLIRDDDADNSPTMFERVSFWQK
jgi:hypothetical protein